MEGLGEGLAFLRTLRWHFLLEVLGSNQGSLSIPALGEIPVSIRESWKPQTRPSSASGVPIVNSEQIS